MMSDDSSPLHPLTPVYAQPHRNQYLFSDHYLNVILPRDPRWDAAAPATLAFVDWLKQLYAEEGAQLSAYNEAQLEEHWFKPIFDRLGHSYEPQASVPGLGQEGVKQPDYVFFPTQADRQAAVAVQKTSEYGIHALAVGEVKQWEVNLSKKAAGGGATFDRQNPSYQIDYYLKATGLAWGILTNGRVWRLVHRESSYRLDVYYEVDLLDLLPRADADAWRYFWLFFAQTAFLPDAQGRVFLDDVLAGSHAYAVALEEDLQENAYRALEHLMQGFLDFQPNALGADELRAIYDNSLYLLYRLLFVLYGESRGVLPMENPRYRERHSLQRIKEEIAVLLDRGEFVSQYSTVYWHRLENLFHLINGDDPRFNTEIRMVRYNGGLFDPTLHPFLTERQVGDRALMTVIDLLSRREAETGKEFADYRTLGVRHLGSIYEGLLEYQPRLATERMATLRDGKGERWLPAAQIPSGAKCGETREAGQIYLATDKGERKATGSYYTPQYIVRYIVEQTLEPLVEGCKRQDAGNENPESSIEHRDSKIQNFADAVLALKILDPAMGSGHFLVEAADYLARTLCTAPYAQADRREASDLAYWRRRVVERCIYGVDKNPLAVELAKLSLWLATFAADKPLSFLDHHLKCGDSLVGARVADLGSAPEVLRAQKRKNNHVAEGQLNLFEYLLSQRLPVVLSKILEIVGRESDSYETVRAKEAADHAVRDLKAPFNAVADLWASAYFGHTYTQSDYLEALNLLHTPEKLLALPVVQQAQAIAAERGFFHWELTFPEVFFDFYGQSLGEAAGFDVVIGNPPYVDIKRLEKIISDYLFETYETMRWRLNLFAAFLEKGLNLTKVQGAKIAHIVPTSLLTQVSYAGLRSRILTNCVLRNVVRLPNELFGEAMGEVKVDTCIVVIDKIAPTSVAQTRILVYDSFKRISEISEDTAAQTFSVSQQGWTQRETMPIVLRKDEDYGMIESIRRQSLPLEKYCEFCLGITPYDQYAGHTQEQIDRKIFHAKSQLDSDYRKLLLSGDVNRYQVQWNGVDWIKYGEWLAAPREQRFFTQERLLVQQIIDWSSLRIFVGWTNEELYNTQNQFNLLAKDGTNLKFILAILNSKLISYYHRREFLDIGLQRFQKILIKDAKILPIRRIDFTTPAAERAVLVTQAQALYATGDSAALLAFAQARLAAQPEQVDVLHDLLAYLAEQMIALNKDKRVIVNKFWNDLEGVTHTATFARLQKGKQGRSLWAEVACQPFTTADSHTTHSLEESLAWSEDAFKGFLRVLAAKIKGLSALLDVYRAYTSEYRVIVARLTTTDRLIDQSVYQLYGLTTEEIAVVEGQIRI